MSLILLVIIFTALVCSVSQGSSNCVGKFPNTGVWTEKEPHWIPQGCSIRAFNQSMAAKCLRGKTVYVIGSSIARNYAFELAQLLGAKEMSRTDQKDKCQHSAMTWDGCVNEVENVKFKVLYLQYIDGLDYSSRGGFHHMNARPKPNALPRKVLTPSSNRNRYGVDPALRSSSQRPDVKITRPAVKDDLLSLPYSYNYPTDVNYTTPRQLQKWAAPLDVCFNLSAYDCLQPFFAGSTSSDLLILSVGLNYAVNMIDFSPINYTSWISESAINFKRAVNALFPGRVVRGTLSEVRNNLKHEGIDYNRFIWRTEKLLTSIFDSSDRRNSAASGTAAAVPPGAWFTIDQWAINTGRLDYYQDFVHFHGPLTMAFLHNVLSEVCP